MLVDGRKLYSHLQACYKSTFPPSCCVWIHVGDVSDLLASVCRRWIQFVIQCWIELAVPLLPRSDEQKKKEDPPPALPPSPTSRIPIISPLLPPPDLILLPLLTAETGMATGQGMKGGSSTVRTKSHAARKGKKIAGEELDKWVQWWGGKEVQGGEERREKR